MSDANPLLLANQVCFALYSASHAMTRVYRPLLDALGLTYPQYLVMMLLWERDGRSVKDLGEQLGLDSGTLTPLLKRLEAQGMVARSRDPADERVVRVRLTEAGTGLRDKALGTPREILKASGHTIAELSAIRDDLNVLKARLEEAAAGIGED